MPTVTINGVQCPFTPGQTILQAANAAGVDIPFYCYHDGLSIVASCRICLGEVWAPNPRNENRLEPFMGGKLLPTCQTPASDGMVVHTDSPKAVQNQKAVMEYLLINHPLDCPVCDQAGECLLQDYSFKYGRGVSRFQEQKVKNPKKDLGPHVYLYADRCIMCTRCVRFTREVSGTAELYVDGRGNKEEIDVFPGHGIDNPLSANVIDLCPVGALLDKDFLFAQRVWFLRSTPSIDGITAGGDNIWIEHNEGRVYRLKPRENHAVNKWWITDEVRYGWKHIHSDSRLRTTMRRQYGALVEDDSERCYADAIDGMRRAAEGGRRLALLLSPMLTCEDAWTLATLAREIDTRAILGLGPVPRRGEDQTFPPGVADDDPRAFTVYAEKAPNARGVRRVLAAVGGETLDHDAFVKRIAGDEVGAVILTGNYTDGDWAPQPLAHAADRRHGKFVVLIDTLGGPLIDGADVVLPGCTWAEKAGTFENARGLLQAFEAAIPPVDLARSEGQIAFDLQGVLHGDPLASSRRVRVVVVDEQPGMVPQATEVVLPRSRLFNAAQVRAEMALATPALAAFATEVALPAPAPRHEPAVEMVEL